MLDVSPIAPYEPRRSSLRDPWTEAEARAARAAAGQRGLAFAAFAQLRPTLGDCLVQRGELRAAAVVRHLRLWWTRRPGLGGRARCEGGVGGRA